MPRISCMKYVLVITEDRKAVVHGQFGMTYDRLECHEMYLLCKSYSVHRCYTVSGESCGLSSLLVVAAFRNVTASACEACTLPPTNRPKPQNLAQHPDIPMQLHFSRT